ncbi:family 20 glycosylhydrolase, partial [Bacillus cereus group sp. Bce037]
LAYYKFNTFHWHLTDDEGWRIEIKSLPQLTDIGAWRGVDEELEPQYSTLTERHGGFYRQHEIKEVIAYAAERGITVIPEIDIPGHSRAAIKS